MELTRSIPRHLYRHLIHRCTDRGLSRQLKQLHARLILSSTTANDFLASKLSETHQLTYARHLFDQIPNKNTSAYNALLIAYSLHNHHSEALNLFRSYFSHRNDYWDMGDSHSDCSTLSYVLKSMASDGPHLAKMMHCYVIKRGLGLDVSVGNGLLTYYSRCSDVVSARALFDEMPARDLISWNSMISGYSQGGFYEECRDLYKIMLDLEDVRPDSFTLSCLLKAMSEATSGGPHSARMIHCYMITSGLDSNVFVGNWLVTYYSSCGDVVSARALFDEMPVKDLASWNSMISGYSQGGFYEECKSLYKTMLDSEDVRPNGHTALSVLQSCARAADLVFGSEVYQYMIGNGIEIDISLCNSIIGIFAKCGSLDCAGELFKEISENELTYDTIISGYMNHGFVDVAMKIFRQMRKPELSSWNAVLSGFVQNKRHDKVLDLVHEMQVLGYKPNGRTLSSILPAIAVVSNFIGVNEIHAYAIKNNLDRNIDVATALIDAYAKLGFLNAAHVVYNQTKNISVEIWTAMISAYATYGDPNVALSTFDKMLFSNIRPNAGTLTAVLKACGKAGLVDAAEEIYDYLFLKFKVQPSDTDYASLVMCLCRAGKLPEAVEFVKELPVEPCAQVLGALLSGASEHGDVKLAEFVCRHLLELEPENPSNYIVMANLYSQAGRWEEAAGFRNRLAKMGCMEVAASIPMYTNGGLQRFIEGGHTSDEGADCWNTTVYTNTGMVELEYAAA